MEKANKYPLLPFTVAYVGGIIGAWLWSPSPWLAAIGSGLLIVFAVIFLNWRQALLPLLGAALGVTNFSFQSAIFSPTDLRRSFGENAELVVLRGRLLETPALRMTERAERPSWRSMARLETTASQTNGGAWRPAVGKVLVNTSGMLTNFYAGQWVQIAGVLAKPASARAEGLFNYRQFLEKEQIYFQLTADSSRDWSLVQPYGVMPLSDRFQAWARKALQRGLPFEDESLHLEWALTLGWKTALTEQVSEPFIRAATYHIFAVDGLRMAIIFSIFYSIFRLMNLSRRTGGAFLLPIIWFYVMLTGWPASAIRAAIMITVVIAGWILRRPPNLGNSLLTAALIILLWKPHQLFQAGFQLSFLVVACIIVLMPFLTQLVERWFKYPLDEFRPKEYQHRLPGFVRVPSHFGQEIFLTSFAAWIGSVPLAAYYFNVVSPVSTPANLLAVPLCMLVLISNFASFLLISWFPAAAELFNYAGWGCMEIIRNTSAWFSKWPMACYYVSAPSFLSCATYYVWFFALVTGAALSPRIKWAKWVAVGTFTLIWTTVTVQQNLGVSRLTVLPVSGGAALHVGGLPQSGDVLINCGSEAMAASMIRPFLRAQGVNRLSHLVLGEGEIRQIGGAPLIINSFAVPEVWTAKNNYRSSACKRVLKEINSMGGPQLKTACLEKPIGLWQVLYPTEEDHFSLASDNAIVLKATIRGSRVLMLSDLGLDGQRALLEHGGDLQADILITGIPTRGEAAGDPLLDAVRPSLIIITDSETPYASRAKPHLIERLARRNIPVLYTRHEGAVTLELRNRQWKTHTAKGTLFSDHRDVEHVAKPGSRPAGLAASRANL